MTGMIDSFQDGTLRSKQQTWDVRKYLVESEFSPLNKEEISRVKEKLSKLEEIVKDMPFKNREKPNGC